MKMKTKSLLSVICILGVMFFTSCQKDDPSPLSKTEAESSLRSVSTDYIAVRSEYEASSGASAQSALNNLTLPFSAPTKAPAQIETAKKEFLKSIKPSFVKGNDDPFVYFDFNQYVGTWTYNSTTHVWTRTTTPANSVVLVFPFTLNGVTKTATVTYYDYQSAVFNQETYVTQLKFKIEIEGTTGPVYSWIYKASQTLTSQSASFEYTIGLFSQSESYDASMTISATLMKMNVSMSFEVKKSGAVVYSTSATVALTSTDTGKYTLAANAQLRLMNIIIKWDIAATETTVTSDPNNLMKISVWTSSGAKVGDVKLVYNSTTQDWEPEMYFSDGTHAPVTTYFNAELLYEIKDFMDSITGIGLGK